MRIEHVEAINLLHRYPEERRFRYGGGLNHEGARRTTFDPRGAAKGHERHLSFREGTRRGAKDTSLSTKGREPMLRTQKGNRIFFEWLLGPSRFSRTALSRVAVLTDVNEP